MPCHIKLDIFKSDHTLEGEQQKNTTCEQQKAEKQHTDIRPPSLFPHLRIRARFSVILRIQQTGAAECQRDRLVKQNGDRPSAD